MSNINPDINKINENVKTKQTRILFKWQGKFNETKITLF